MRTIEKAPRYKIKDVGELINFIDGPLGSQVDALVNRINQEYYYWEKVKYLPIPEGITHEQLWMMVKLRRRTTPYHIVFGRYDFFWSLPVRLQEMLHLFDLNIGGSISSHDIIPEGEKNRYLVSSVMEEAIASSQIEGAATTRRTAKEMLRRNSAPKNKSERMISNNYASINKILEWKHQELTLEKLLELHKLVTHQTLDDAHFEGKFRTNDDVNVVDVIDGEIVHQPPAIGELPELLEQLCVFFNQDNREIFIHPIVKACIIHFLMGYIHPFVDGNGRTARALFYWYLLKKGYWLTEYLSISRLILRSRNQYARAFQYTETDENDLTYFISYQLRTMKLAYDSLREYIQRKMEERKQAVNFMLLEGINQRQALILKWFDEEPNLILLVREVETKLSVSNQTARVDLQGLEDSGYLTAVNRNKKEKLYIRSEAFPTLIRKN
jgi:Fic family protein